MEIVRRFCGPLPSHSFRQSLIVNMLAFTSFVITALLSATGSNAAPLIQERGVLVVRYVCCCGIDK
jgi:hypothetical protein